MEFKINKDNWEKVTLGDVVFEPKETAKYIIAEGFEHIVGLEHIDSGDVHLRNSFSIDTDTTFTKVFRAGDVLFGRRRAYLKKAAQATFDGVCSGDITVIRANDKLDVRLLPFVIHNDKFFDYAVKHSAGGLSPRVKFKDLANYEFFLPPKEQQAELAELLWAMDNVIEKDLEVLESLEQFSKSFFYDNVFKIEKSSKVNLGSICTPKQWKTIEIKNLTEEGFLVYGGNGIIGKYNEYNHENPVIAVACRGEYCGNVHLTQPKSYVTGNSMCLDDLNTNIFDTKFLYYYLYYSNLDSVISGSAQPQIIKEDLSRYKILLIDINRQIEIVNKLEEIFNSINDSKSKLQSSKALQKALINQVF